MTVQGTLLHQRRAVEMTLDRGRVKSVAAAAGNGTRHHYIAKGFLDLQVNGFQGIDYSGAELEVGDVRRVVDALAAYGTTRHFPTIITSSQERIERNLAIIAQAVASDRALAYRVPGVHVEGPYISAEDGPRGAHDRRYVRSPSLNEIEGWMRASNGMLALVTLAPEVPGAAEAIGFLTANGVRVALGHHAGSSAEITAAADAGASLSTHLGNGSHAVLPRLDNYIWHQLGENRLWASIIADGFHLPDSVLRVFSRAKGAERLLLVSDVAPIAGRPAGRYRWGEIEIEVHEDGHVGLADTPYLAGAGHLLNHAIAVFARATGWSLSDSVRLATESPERYLGVREKPAGADVAAGDPCDLVRFSWNPAIGPLQIQAVYAPDRSYVGEAQHAGGGAR